jgi:hypothetical protein
MDMQYKTFMLNKTFESGMAVQKVRSFLAANNAGEAIVRQIHYSSVEVEVQTFNPRIMAWVEDQFADFV